MAELSMQDMAGAVLAWMEYESLCGRKRILIERTLAYPIAGYVAGRGQYVKPEEPVPGTRLGTRPRIDYAFWEKEDGPVVAYMETKLNSSQVAGDLVRLLGLTGRRYFLCAQVDSVGKAKSEMRDMGLVSPSTDDPIRHISEDDTSTWCHVREAHLEWRKSLENPIPLREFWTQLVGFDEHPSRNPDAMVAIWEVKDEADRL